MLDHKTNRSRGFGFVTFENEDAVEKIFSNGRMHEIGGKQVSLVYIIFSRIVALKEWQSVLSSYRKIYRSR